MNDEELRRKLNEYLDAIEKETLDMIKEFPHCRVNILMDSAIKKREVTKFVNSITKPLRHLVLVKPNGLAEDH